MYRVLIVEDDPVIAQTLCTYMQRWGLDARGVEDFSNVLREFAAFDPQLVLLDITLPFFDGYHWCAEIRKVSTAPILFISSANDNMNILMALSAGADDFIAKPFDLAVLMAKVQALLRRAYDFAGQSALLTHGDVLLNTADGTVAFRGQKAELTRNENRILTVLMESKGKIVSRDTLMARLWESDAFVDENTLSVNVTRLRRKLEALGVPELIKTRKGMGYIIE
ncbi:MAG: response regulator transcription factor [Clostridiales bacterium]|nr:response regulator transcription factor [Clostridiales bacterium]MDO4349334.1 response regulator transcription factor [Eubacteriales bacterium]MDY4007383.1 response regulator transcription factor [Candidatus Limiplasma sp.]